MSSITDRAVAVIDALTADEVLACDHLKAEGDPRTTIAMCCMCPKTGLRCFECHLGHINAMPHPDTRCDVHPDRAAVQSDFDDANVKVILRCADGSLSGYHGKVTLMSTVNWCEDCASAV